MNRGLKIEATVFLLVAVATGAALHANAATLTYANSTNIYLTSPAMTLVIAVGSVADVADTQSRGADAFHWIRILLPLADSNSITHSSRAFARGAVSSTNAGLVALLGGWEFRRAASSAPYSPAAAVATLDICRVVGPHRGLPQWLRQLRPPRLGAAKLVQLALQLHDCLRDRWCDLAVHYQTLLGA
jgi:hypothetical protein